ncbi:MAG: DUF308 domain-containing protein [Muribaculaceae bacterium]|nr:DUF308 domain-containing protein [Muribaculaceae bacterium]
MNSKATILTNLIILAAGILLCYVHGRDNIPHTIVLVTGLTLIVPALINLFLLFRRRDSDRHRPTSSMKVAGWISSIASIGLGTLMVIAPGLFTPILVYIFGTMMILASLMLIFLLTGAVREAGVPGWLYVGPILVLIAGVVMVCVGQPRITDAMVTLITGISMIVFSLSWLMTGFLKARGKKHIAAATSHEAIEAHHPADEAATPTDTRAE